MSDNFKSSAYNHLGSIFIAAGIIITATILGNSWVSSKRNAENKKAIEVTGKAEKDFTSDLVVWSGNYRRSSSDFKEAYRALKTDQAKIKSFLINKGVKESEITFSSTDVNKETESIYDTEGHFRGQRFIGYTAMQTVTIKSKEVDKIENISREITDLLEQGIELSSNSPSYYYTKLAELKLDLLKQAAADARKRCETILDEAGSGKGHLTKSSMGIFQITGQYSDEEYSYGGTLNTSKKEKTASITVTLEYDID
ncbi:MAG: SIMPL domain-containing protein [Bacteroidota bacterium]